MTAQIQTINEDCAAWEEAHEWLKANNTALQERIFEHLFNTQSDYASSAARPVVEVKSILDNIIYLFKVGSLETVQFNCTVPGLCAALKYVHDTLTQEDGLSLRALEYIRAAIRVSIDLLSKKD